MKRNKKHPNPNRQQVRQVQNHTRNRGCKTKSAVKDLVNLDLKTEIDPETGFSYLMPLDEKAEIYHLIFISINRSTIRMN